MKRWRLLLWLIPLVPVIGLAVWPPSEEEMKSTCLSRGGCWDHERGGCVGAKVLGRELEATERQATLGHCRTPEEDEAYRRGRSNPSSP